MDKALITILDGIGETSMPYNEFVLWRANHCKDEAQILVIIGKRSVTPVGAIPNELRVIHINRNPFEIRKKIKLLLKELDETGLKYAIHLHQLKSASLTQFSMFGTGFRKKTIFTIHSTFTGYAWHNKIQSYFNGFMAKYVTCVSSASYSKYPSSLKRMKGDRVQAIRNGVDIDRINDVLAGCKCQSSEDYVQFVYVARLIPLKNHLFLIEVIKNVSKKAKFVFVGRDGDSGIMDKIKNAGIGDRVILTGQIPREEVFVMLNNSDVYISSSTLEGMPISVLEAMYCKLPAILSDIPQHREIGGSEEFVSYLPFEVDKWVDKINEVVELNRDERKSNGLGSRKYVEDNFSLYVMHQKYDKLYEILRQC